MDYSPEGLAKANRQHDQLKHVEQLRFNCLVDVMNAPDRFEVEHAFDDLCGAHSEVAKSRAALYELCKP
jgi:hypothetical protein